MKTAKDVDEYIVRAPQDLQPKLKQLRKTIHDIAPESVESISYAMPFYNYKGRLVYFAFAKKHIGLYIPPPIIENHGDALKEYHTSKSAVQFPIDKELPIPLIQKLVKARMKWNSEFYKLK